METEEMLLETLKEWRFLKNRLSRLKENLQEQEFRITPTLSEAKVFVIGTSASKVENFCFARMKIEEEMNAIVTRLNECVRAYKNACLTEEERLTIQYTCSGKSLITLQKKLGVSQPKIYRIRARAVKKMYEATQNGVFL